MAHDVPACFEVAVHKQVHRRLRNMLPKHQKQILGRIADLARPPRPHDSIQLKGECSGFRLDVGEYRILYDIDYDARIVQVRLLMQRGEGYSRRRAL